MGSSATKTLLSTLLWIKPFLGWRNLAIGVEQEPALTSANLIIQLFQAPPFKWNWNRSSVSFQTYDTVNPWMANHAYVAGYRLKDSNGNMQTVTTAGTSGAVVPGSQYPLTSAGNASGGFTTYNGTFPGTLSGLTVTISGFVTNPANNGTFVVSSNSSTTMVVNNPSGVSETIAATATITPWNKTNGGTTADGTGTLVWTMSPITDYIQNVQSFGFIEQAFVVDASGNVYEIPKITLELTFDNGVGRANVIAPVMDDNNGNITFRFMPGLPDQTYTVYVIYQNRAQLLTATNGVWPMPDYLAPIYNWGMLALMMLFTGDGRFTWANQKFVGSLLAISEGLSEQEKQIFLDEWLMMTDQKSRKAAKGTQGYQGREV